MNALPRMPESERDSGALHVVQHGVSVVRSAADSAAWGAGQAPGGNRQQTAVGTRRLDRLRAQGSRVAAAGKNAGLLRTGWPGIICGVRAPEIGETPLSDGEWQYLFRGDLT